MNRTNKLLNDLRQGKNNGLKLLDDKNFIFRSSMCETYKQIRLANKKFYTNNPSANNQKSLPKMSLAYSILLYNNVEQFERLLIALYHPNNVYCVHVDAKSNDVIRNAVRSIASCFDNVFVATKLEKVVYAGFSRLQADLNCMSDLLNLTSLINNQHDNLLRKRDIKWELVAFFY